MVAAGHVCALLLVLAGAAGCDPYPTLKNDPVDCTADDGYEFLTVSNFETVGDGAFWGSGDSTPDKVVGDDADGNAIVRSIPDGPRCDSNAAVVLRAAHNNDWGCLFGSNSVGAPRDASAYDGLSFWARAPGNTTKGFIVLMDDPNTTVPDASLPHNCTNLGSITGGPQTINVTIDGQSVQASSGATRPTYPEECGNSYSAVMLVTSDWAFYTIPFARFQQTALPNRVPNAVLTQVGTVPGTALLTDQIYTLVIRFPKEATAELWIDNLAFYRKKTM
jgi:hypothetical protein